MLDELLGADYLCLSLLQKRLGLIDVRDRAFTALKLDLVELQDLGVGVDGLLGKLQLIVVLAQQKIVGGHGIDQRNPNDFLGVL